MQTERLRDRDSLSYELIDRKKVSLMLPGGEKLTLNVTLTDRNLSDLELTALTVMRMAIPLTFTDETTGVDQAGYLVEREKDIHSLPGGRESVPKEALTWAGSILMREEWTAQRVANLLASEFDHIGVGLQLGSISRDKLAKKRGALRHTVASFYPGGISGEKRRKPVGDW